MTVEFTSEYVPIGMIGDGLNRAFYGRNTIWNVMLHHQWYQIL